MTGFLINALAFIVAISVLVAVHEFGHYLVGRWCGMKVLRFSIGFGRPIWSYVAGKDRTEYRISAIPLGGYVKFLDEREGPVAASDQGRAFTHRPVPSRIAVLLAGPFFNFLFAVLAYWVLFIYGVPTLRPAVGTVEAGSYAAAAGLEYGDRILSVGERPAPDWETALVSILDEMIATGRVPMELEGGDGFRRRTVIDVGDDAARLTEPGLLFDGLGFRPWQPPAVIGSLEPEGAAMGGGLEAGDRITAIDGEEVVNFADLQRIVSARPERTVTVRVLRDGEPLDLPVTVGVREQDGERRGFLGVGVTTAGEDYWYLRQFGPLESVPEALARTWATTTFTLRMLGRIVVGDVSIRNISGPISIAQIAGDSAARGLQYFLDILAVISISLGVINLLPIPILDGGQIVYQSVELFKGSPMSERAQILGQQIGILALILLMSLAFYNDIVRLLQ